jgi:hypothetical protein
MTEPLSSLPVPDEVLLRNKVEPMALINFLKDQRTVMLPDMSRINETVQRRDTNGNPIEVTRGFGYDCTCFGTGWKNGQVLCGRHIPDERNRYIVTL